MRFFSGAQLAYQFITTTDASGNWSVDGIAPGVYDIEIKGAHTLSNRRANVQVSAGANSGYYGLLLEGDANGDDLVDITDFSLLRVRFFTSDPLSDYNQDGIVDIVDFSILRGNFGRWGPIAVNP